MLFYLFLALIVITLAVGVIFLLLFFLKRKVKNTVELFPAGSALPLDGLDEYFSSVRHDNATNTIVFRQVSNFRRCVVAVVYSSNGKKSFKRFVLNFNENKQVCGIQLSYQSINEFNVFVESVDGRMVKHKGYDNSLFFAIIYGATIAVLYAAAIISLVFYDSGFLAGYYPAYALYYGLAALGLLFPAIGIGGFLLIDFLSKK